MEDLASDNRLALSLNAFERALFKATVFDDGDRTKLSSMSLKLITGAGVGVPVLSTVPSANPVGVAVDSGELVIREPNDSLCCGPNIFGEITGVVSTLFAIGVDSGECRGWLIREAIDCLLCDPHETCEALEPCEPCVLWAPNFLGEINGVSNTMLDGAVVAVVSVWKVVVVLADDAVVCASEAVDAFLECV